MDWLSQCVAYVKETLPPGTIVSVSHDNHLVRGNNKRQQQQLCGGSGFVAQENGKRRRLVQEEDVSKQSSSINGNTDRSNQSRPPQYSWFHPSHPLREDPRITARRYNSGYDLESEVEFRDGRTNGSNATTHTSETRMGNGRRVKEKSAAEQEPVNFDRVIFAEQVLKPVYHSPYPEIKPENDSERPSRRTDLAPKGTSSRRAQAEPRNSQQDYVPRSPGIRNGVFKIINGGTGIRRRERSSEAGHVASVNGQAVEGELSGVGETRRENGNSNEVESDRTALDDHDYAPAESERLESIRTARNRKRHHPRAEEEIPYEMLDDQDDEDYTPEATDRPKHAKPVRPAQNYQQYVSRTEEEAPRAPQPIKPSRSEAKPDETTAHPRSLWVCDRCFKYMPMESAYVSHTKGCAVNFPPGRKVYEKANWGIWEIDGQVDKLYCQNLSLFGKLFIDHKSICFDVESFHYYVLTDSHPKRDHVIAYFCKEKFSIDDFNLATILVFPHVQQSGFGRLLMEFSYHLTKNSPTPGTPERPLSLLGARSYESLWMAMLVRYLIDRLLEREDEAPKGRGKKVDTYMRVWERRKRVIQDAKDGDDYLNYEDLRATPDELERQEEQLPLTATMTVEELARECNLKNDDLLCLLDALGVLDQRQMPRPAATNDTPANKRAEQPLARRLHLTDWSQTQVAIDFELIVKIIGTWRIPAKPLLDETCCWIRYTGGPVVKPVPKKTWPGYM